MIVMMMTIIGMNPVGVVVTETIVTMNAVHVIVTDIKKKAGLKYQSCRNRLSYDLAAGKPTTLVVGVVRGIAPVCLSVSVPDDRHPYHVLMQMSLSHRQQLQLPEDSIHFLMPTCGSL